MIFLRSPLSNFLTAMKGNGINKISLNVSDFVSLKLSNILRIMRFKGSIFTTSYKVNLQFY